MSYKMEIPAIGIDFSNDYTQVSYMLTSNDAEPESLSVIPGENKYLIPTVLYRSTLSNSWYIGDDAIAYAKAESGEVLDELVDKILAGKDIKLGKDFFSVNDILYHYLRSLFDIIERNLLCDKIDDISVAVENPDKEMIESIYFSLIRIGYIKENIRVIDHAEAFIYYTLNQKKELWVNDVALFDFNKNHFIFRRLRTMRNQTPRIVRVADVDYSDVFSMDMLSSQYGEEKADKKFFQIIQENFRKSVVSAVFLTGDGFYDKNWAKDSQDELVSKRRVFKGYNLFVKGAAYAAMKRYKKIESLDYLFDCVGRTKVNVNLLIMHEGRNMSLSLSKAGTNWYEAGAQTECILDDINRIQVIITEPISTMSRNISVELPAFPERPNKATRIRITLAYVDDVNFVLKVEDLGFGEFFKPSEASVIKNINIENLF